MQHSHVINAFSITSLNCTLHIGIINLQFSNDFSCTLLMHGDVEMIPKKFNHLRINFLLLQFSQLPKNRVEYGKIYLSNKNAWDREVERKFLQTMLLNSLLRTLVSQKQKVGCTKKKKKKKNKTVLYRVQVEEKKQLFGDCSLSLSLSLSWLRYEQCDKKFTLSHTFEESVIDR